MKKMFVNKFVIFGNICSIFVIINFAKMMISMAIDCFMLRKIGAGLKDICRFTISPSTFLLNKLPGYEIEAKNWKQTTNNSPTENLWELKKLNEQKLGPI